MRLSIYLLTNKICIRSGPGNNGQKRITSVFASTFLGLIPDHVRNKLSLFLHEGFTRLPRWLMSWLNQELLKQIAMPKLMIGCQGQWRAGPMNRIVFQPDGTPMVPIFHYSNCERSERTCANNIQLDNQSTIYCQY